MGGHRVAHLWTTASVPWPTSVESPSGAGPLSLGCASSSTPACCRAGAWPVAAGGRLSRSPPSRAFGIVTFGQAITSRCPRVVEEVPPPDGFRVSGVGGEPTAWLDAVRCARRPGIPIAFDCGPAGFALTISGGTVRGQNRNNWK